MKTLALFITALLVLTGCGKQQTLTIRTDNLHTTQFGVVDEYHAYRIGTNYVASEQQIIEHLLTNGWQQQPGARDLLVFQRRSFKPVPEVEYMRSRYTNQARVEKRKQMDARIEQLKREGY